MTTTEPDRGAWIAISVDEYGQMPQVIAIGQSRDLTEGAMYSFFDAIGAIHEGDERTENKDGTLFFTDDRHTWQGFVMPLTLPKFP
jgi:hypothetical protein